MVAGLFNKTDYSTSKINKFAFSNVYVTWCKLAALKQSEVLIHVKAILVNMVANPVANHFTLVNYDSRVVPDWKIPHITTLES